MREKRLYFWFSHFQRMPFVVKQDKPAKPVDVRTFSPPGIVKRPAPIADLIQQL
jgi:hypothetical protein